MIEEALHAIGAPGWLIITVSTLVGLYHFRNVLGIAAVVGSWLRMAGVAAALFVIVSSGVIPGVDIDLQLHLDVLADIARSVWNIVSEFGGVVV